MSPVIPDIFLFQFVSYSVYELVSDDTGKQMRFRINIFLMEYWAQIQIGFQATESTFNLTYNVIYFPYNLFGQVFSRTSDKIKTVGITLFVSLPCHGSNRFIFGYLKFYINGFISLPLNSNSITHIIRYRAIFFIFYPFQKNNVNLQTEKYSADDRNALCSRYLIRKMKIAIQGVAGAFHDEAARRFFGEDIGLIECDTFRLLCGKVDSGEADYGIMAIEFDNRQIPQDREIIRALRFL
jgi:DNA integrity scanning protein DisA with diadenylate cyclase activity